MLLKITTSIALIVACWSAGHCNAQVFVEGYFRSNGTYVQPHFRSEPDGNFGNNWTTKGNSNPYSGMPGTRSKPQSKSYAVTPSRGTFSESKSSLYGSPSSEPDPVESESMPPKHESFAPSSNSPEFDSTPPAMMLFWVIFVSAILTYLFISKTES